MREPRIRELGSEIHVPAEITGTGRSEHVGYLLNGTKNDNACAFLDRTNLCSSYETRPWACRVFDCDGENKDELVQLGILPKRESRER